MPIVSGNLKVDLKYVVNWTRMCLAGTRWRPFQPPRFSISTHNEELCTACAKDSGTPRQTSIMAVLCTRNDPFLTPKWPEMTRFEQFVDFGPDGQNAVLAGQLTG